MTIRHFPLLIIFLFAATLLQGCSAVDDAKQVWQNRNTPNASVSNSPPQVNTPNIPAPTRVESTVNQGFDNLPEVKVAILLPLSGAQEKLGQSMLQAAQLALFDIGYNNFKLIPRDTKGTTNGATKAANDALADGAQLILGPLFADSVRAVKIVAKPRNINVIAFSTDQSLADRQTFLMGFMPLNQVDRIAQYSVQNGYRDFALVAPQDIYGDLVTRRFEQAVMQNGGRVAQSIRFNNGDPDVINQVAALNQDNGGQNFRAVFMPVGGSQIETISSALSYNKMMPSQFKRIGTGLWDDTRIANQPNMQGAWFAAPAPKARAEFEQQYFNTYGEHPARLGTLAYDATALAAILARKGFQQGNAPAFDHRALTNRNGFSGTDGVFRFQPNGIVERALAVLELRHGRIIEIDPAPTRF